MKFNIGKKIAPYVLGAGLLFGATGVNAQTNVEPDSSQTNKNYTICLPGAVKTSTNAKKDTAYVKSDGENFIFTEEGTYKVETQIDKNKVSAKESEENNYTKAYTDPLDEKIQEQDSTIQTLQAQLDSANNYFMKGAFSLSAGGNFETQGTNTFKINPVFGAGYDFHLVRIGDTRLSLGITGYLGAPKLEEISELGEEIVNTDVNNAGPYMYTSNFIDNTKKIKTTQHVADITPTLDFKIGEYGFAVGAGPSFSLINKSTTVDSRKETYITALATGNTIPSDEYNLGSVTTNDNALFKMTGANVELTYFGKSDGKFGLTLGGRNLGSGFEHVDLGITYRLYKK